MTIDTLPRQALGQPRSQAVDRFPDLWAWFRRDHGVWTDIVYGVIPLVPMLILSALPGATLLKAMAEYAFLVVLIFLGLFLRGAWRGLRTWQRKRAEKM